jgi:hypothetical protein
MTGGRRGVAAILVLLVLAAGFGPATAEAGSTTASVALGLAAFAVFNQLIGWPLGPAYAERVVVYAAPPVYVSPAYAAPPAVVYSSPSVYARPHVIVAPATPSVVEYPHGRYELRGDGVSVAYQWVWIPRVPPPPPPPPAGTPPPAPR